MISNIAKIYESNIRKIDHLDLMSADLHVVLLFNITRQLLPFSHRFATNHALYNKQER